MDVRPLPVFALGGIVLALAAQAAAEPAGLGPGREAYLAARFVEAQRAFESVSHDRSATRADLVEAYRHLAVLSLVRGDRAGAARAALRAVSLEPGVAPPEGAPPETPDLFDAARRQAPGPGLACALELPESPAAGAPVGVRVRVTGDAGALAAKVVVSCGTDHEAALERSGAGAAASVAVEGSAAGVERACHARVLTADGATLAEASGRIVAQAGAPLAGAPEPSPAAPSEEGAFPWVWVGVGTATVVAAGVVVAAILLTAPDEASLGSPEVVGP